jgi:Zn-dependent M28 family amino/carboxypeptidase
VTFNADSCYAFVAAQTAFGARVPNTAAHVACGNYLVQTLKRYGAQVVEQKANLTAYNGTVLQSRNIIASWNPHTPNRIFLCAHWDSRHQCDEDALSANHSQPVMGANDGASGVAVLLEIARLVAQKQPAVGLDIILFDSEDYGHSEVEHSFCLGSQYWGRNPHVRPYRARFGILLDMVGGKNPVFAKDQVSMHFAPDVANKVWEKAAQLGFGSMFVPDEGGGVIDDHYYVNMLTGIPCIDIIHYQNGVGFPETWHTTHDVLENIDKNTLHAVGTVVTHVLYELK